MRKSMVFLLGIAIGLMLSISVPAFGSSLVTKITATFNPDLPIYINGEKFELELGAINYKDTNYLSIREVAEATGLEVNWNAETKSVELNSKLVVPDNDDETAVDSENVDNTDPAVHEPTNDSSASKDGFDDVIHYNGKDYVTILGISKKLEGTGLYVNYNPETKENYISDLEGPGGNVLIDRIPYITIDGYKRVEYEFYLKTIDPLID